MYRTLLHGMRFAGYHGADAEERNRAQPVVVDVEGEGDFSEAAAHDDLSLTVDYQEVVKKPEARIGGPLDYEAVEITRRQGS